MISFRHVEFFEIDKTFLDSAKRRFSISYLSRIVLQRVTLCMSGKEEKITISKYGKLKRNSLRNKCRAFQ